MDKWHEDGILFNIFEHFPTSDLGASIGDVFHHRDLFENQIGGNDTDVLNMWLNFNNLLVTLQGVSDKLI